ncbi:MAG: DoxX family protein [Gordonia sp. (in: high G+C Gram-positive bacteria)]|uniref:DoxX family protein n=1 Tax=Gordonia sp. (in: high G+C Gram-positive bacteria) TaxID=84139 RepID=UPI003BB761FC
MSSTDDDRPRRSQPDRDSFYDKHAHQAGVVTGSGAASSPPTDLTEGSSAGLPEAVVLGDGSAGLPTVEINRADVPAATRTDVRTESDVVVTEPFVDVDDATSGLDEAPPRRRLSEHFTEEPLPYVEPTHTVPLEIDDDVALAQPPAAYSAVPATTHGASADDHVFASTGRGTIDLGLLILRIVVGLIFVFHGLQKLTTWGWVNGMGVDGFAGFLANNAAGQDAGLGFNSSAVHTLSLAGGVTETVAGILLILGLLTPIAGAGALGVMIVAITYLVTLAGGFSFFAGAGGFEFEYLLAAAVIAIILCGPGAYSVDRRWSWSRRPAWGSVAWLVIAIAAAVAVWIVFNGVNPLHGH